MRLDKYLQVSRIVKRRTVAKDLIEKGRVKVNGKEAKPALSLTIDDNIEIMFGDYTIVMKVIKIEDKVKKENAADLYEIIEKRENT
jgi:ribosomal 50S subunit-recycling heat shock protein